jgi:hypothetical protein
MTHCDIVGLLERLRVVLAPTGKRRLFTEHTQFGHMKREPPTARLVFQPLFFIEERSENERPEIRLDQYKAAIGRKSKW